MGATVGRGESCAKLGDCGPLRIDVDAAKRLYAPEALWSAESVGVFIQSVLQGAFIFAKAEQGPEVAREALSHLRRRGPSPAAGMSRSAAVSARCANIFRRALSTRYTLLFRPLCSGKAKQCLPALTCLRSAFVSPPVRRRRKLLTLC
jgi:hypothetical protein